MEILTQKQTNVPDYFSRYSNLPFYYNEKDNKYMYGLGSQLSEATSYVVVEVKDTTTLDSLANDYYGRPDYYWVIADFNRISDPFINLYNYFAYIKIPTLSNIEYTILR